jgi:hypothetical protein
MVSKSTGDIYFVNRETGETAWTIPEEKVFYKSATASTYLPDSVEALRLAAEDRVLEKLGIMSCHQIRLYLETTKMTEREQVEFIKMHAKDTVELRKILRSGEFNCDQFRMLGDMGAEAIFKLKNTVTNLIKSTTEEPKDEEEIECLELRKKVEEFHKNNPAISKTHWKKIAESATSMIGVLYEKLKQLTYDAFTAFWNS